mmetsp:Transcript_22220/g.27922  ORF Transcript_22220/g.27922 Transcript_22220/m.27922 type:complete len:107 (-) Transcript_22220:131-451(-)
MTSLLLRMPKLCMIKSKINWTLNSGTVKLKKNMKIQKEMSSIEGHTKILLAKDCSRKSGRDVSPIFYFQKYLQLLSIFTILICSILAASLFMKRKIVLLYKHFELY